MSGPVASSQPLKAVQIAAMLNAAGFTQPQKEAFVALTRIVLVIAWQLNDNELVSLPVDILTALDTFDPDGSTSVENS